MKKTVMLFFALFALAVIPIRCLAYEDGDTVDITSVMEESLESIDLAPWQRFISDNEFFESITSASGSITEYIKKLIAGDAVISFDGFINAVFADFIAALKSHMNLAAILFGIAAMSAVLEKFSKSIFKGNISAAASNILFCCAVGLIIKSFADVISRGVGAVNNMSDFIDKSLPVLMSLVTAIQSATSSQILRPSVIMIVELTVKLINCIIIPLLSSSAVLSIAYNVSKSNTFSEISGSIKKLADWIIGIMFTLFFGIISIQKLTSSALDGISVKAVKYTLSSFSLYGGSFLSKSFDVVTGCAIIMKNVLGGISMIILLSICIAPAVYLLSISVVYRITAFLASLIGETRISGCLCDIGKIYGTVFLCVMTASVLFFMLLSVITAVGNTLIGI